jgi:uncharacterized membrane protein
MASTAKHRRKEALRRGQLAPARPIVPAPAQAPDPKDSKPRYHAIDALRGMAMFLVISLHAALG